MEQQLKKASSLADIHQAAENSCAVEESMQELISLLQERISRQQLKEEPVHVFEAASDGEIDGLWDEMAAVDPTLTHSDFNIFQAHCCIQCHYFFVVKKCGDVSCEM